MSRPRDSVAAPSAAGTDPGTTLLEFARTCRTENDDVARLCARAADAVSRALGGAATSVWLTPETMRAIEFGAPADDGASPRPARDGTDDTGLGLLHVAHCAGVGPARPDPAAPEWRVALRGRGPADSLGAISVRLPASGTAPSDRHRETAEAIAGILAPHLESAVLAARLAAADAAAPDHADRGDVDRRLDLLLEATGDAVWDLDLRRGTAWWNAAYAAKFGTWDARSPTSLVDWHSWQSSVDRIHPDDRARIAASYIATVQGNADRWSAEYRLRRVDGEYADVLCRMRIVRDVRGEAVRVVGSLLDLTAPRRVEEGLRVKSLGLDSIGQTVVAMDLDGTVTYANRAMESVFGWPPAELVGRPVLETFVPEELLDDARAILDGIRRGEAWTGEYPLRRRDGVVLPTLVSNSPVRDENGKLIGLIAVGSDLSEQKAAEATLEHTRSMLELAITAGRCIAWEMDVDSGHLWRSASGSAILGMTSEPAGAFGPEFASRMDPVDRAAWSRARDRLRPDAPSFQLRYRYQRPDGTVARLEDHVRGEFGPDGRLVRLVGLAIDVTNRDRVLDALAESEERLRSVLDHAPAMVFIQDLKGRYLFVNHQCEATLGVRSEELVGRTAEEALPPAVAAALVANDRHAAESLCLEDGTETIPGAFPGDDRTIVTVRFPLLRADGQAYAICGISRDDTERLRAVERLRRSEARLSAVLESAIECVVTFDSTGRILHFNPAAETTFGYSAAEAVGASALDLLTPPAVRAQWEARFANLVRGGASLPLGRQVEIVARRSDGTEFPIEVSMARVGSEEPPIFTAFVRDITERKWAIDSLSKSERFAHGIVDALPARVCVLDARGQILLVNRTWETFARESGTDPERTGVGSNYLAVCDEAERAGEADAGWTARGIRALLAGEQSRFSRAYTCSTPGNPDEVSWYLVDATRFDGDGEICVIVAHEDITALHRAEQSLRSSDERLRFALEAAHAGTWEWDPDTRTGFWSDESYRLIGLDRAQFPAGRDAFRRSTHPDDVERIQDLVRRAIEDGSGFETDFRIVRPDGEVRWLRTIGRTRAPARPGRARRILGLQIDVTERREVEQALRVSDQKLQLALEAAGQATFEMDVETRAIEVGPSFPRMLGYEPGEFDAVWDPSHPRVHHGDDAAFEAIYDAVRRGEQSRVSLEYRARTRSGEWRWIAFHGRAIGGPTDGSRRRMVGILRDVTQQRQAQDEIHALAADLELRVAERTRELEARNLELERTSRDLARLVDVLDSTTDYIAVFDVRSGTIAYANRAYQELLGESVVGWHADRVLPRLYRPEGARMLREGVAPLVAEQGRWSGQNLVRHHDGREIPVSQLVLAHYRPDGSLESMSTIMRSIAEFLRVENALREKSEELALVNHELQRSVRLKDEFLASMSHELRTPLNGVLSVSEALREGAYGDLSARQLEMIGTIRHSGQHLLTVINDILDIAKIEAGRIEIDVHPVSVETVCRASLRMVEQMARAKSQRVAFHRDLAASTLDTDERRLRQILVNLLGNAVKFTPEGGAIGLEARCDERGEAIEFTVWDEGIGISAKDRTRIFEPFVQLDGRLARQFGGTGLGLALVSRMTDLLGGRVRVQANGEQGSRFTVSLPLHGATALR